MTYRFYNQLPQDAYMIREKVFVEEQGFKNEFDEIDQSCLHLVVYDEHIPMGCARMFVANEEMTLGRIAVLKEYRSKHIGSEILYILEQKANSLGYSKVTLSAQVRASSFYQKNGYIQYGEEYLDEFCPHIHMHKMIK